MTGNVNFASHEAERCLQKQEGFDDITAASSPRENPLYHFGLIGVDAKATSSLPCREERSKCTRRAIRARTAAEVTNALDQREVDELAVRRGLGGGRLIQHSLEVVDRQNLQENGVSKPQSRIWQSHKRG